MAPKRSKNMRLSELGEFNLIKRVRNKCPAASRKIIRGIGDDTAVIKAPSGKMLVSSDMMVEKVHFDLSFTTFYQLGYKLLAVNISDILAMGGDPKYFLLSLAVPKNYEYRHIDDLYSGIMKLAGKFGISVIGGDTCVSGQGLVMSGTIVGDAERVINRSGARPGDGIFITDTLGDSAMGYALLKKMRRRVHLEGRGKRDEGRKANKDHLQLLRKHLMPEPQPLKNMKNITSMIDVSDGLLVDLSHICDESGAGAIIYTDKIPVSGELAAEAKSLCVDPVRFALKGGEDYALLFTAPYNSRRKAFKIGEIIKKGRFLIDPDGRKTRFRAEGYEHFK